MTALRHLPVAGALLVCVPTSTIAATTEQWRQRAPRWETISTRSLQDIQGRLGSHWAGTLSAKIVAMPIDKGMSYTNSGSNRDILVDLTEEGDHRRIRLWLRKFVGITAGAKEQVEKLGFCA